ncbi:AzlD domain-containing protein [Salibacterium qingdaonense]|uniref:Branched-chain amino acid transport protein n=1 Tax=Salibacterium qingdaonense TaxID=266892 RepID=A0A1I4IGP4_9BACI|nr:AzlD domain-containing protein [Salibacterium qingdaonense]SFL53465.1 Branched-chain amino acid transport protein [Salibacterium qingdaonense]
MSREIIIIIVGMALVTYIPRMLPFVFFRTEKIPPKIEGILKNVPYAALGALIFPGAVFIHDNPLFGITGIAAAFLISLTGGGLIVVVLGSIAVLTILTPLFQGSLF